METIRIYLENLFAGLPKDERLTRAKAELFSTMEDKYNELKSEGKGENEAVGIVISEFGNIDELLDELDIKRESEKTADNAVFLEEDTVRSYLRDTEGFARRVAAGITLCILAPAALIGASTLLPPFTAIGEDKAGTIGLLALFALIAVGIVLFITGGVAHEKYDEYERRIISMPEAVRGEVEKKSAEFSPRFSTGLAAGFVLIFAGVAALIGFPTLMGDNDISGGVGVTVMLALIAFGVMHFVRAGVVKDGYDTLLGKGDHTAEKKQLQEIHHRETVAAKLVNAIIWPAALTIFLVIGLKQGLWHPTWLVFPAAAMLCGIVSSIAEAVAASREGGSSSAIFARCFTSVLWMVAIIVFLVWGVYFRGWALAWIVFPVAGVITGVTSAIFGKPDDD